MAQVQSKRVLLQQTHPVELWGELCLVVYRISTDEELIIQYRDANLYQDLSQTQSSVQMVTKQRTLDMK